MSILPILAIILAFFGVCFGGYNFYFKWRDDNPTAKVELAKSTDVMTEQALMMSGIIIDDSHVSPFPGYRLTYKKGRAPIMVRSMTIFLKDSSRLTHAEHPPKIKVSPDDPVKILDLQLPESEMSRVIGVGILSTSDRWYYSKNVPRNQRITLAKKIRTKYIKAKQQTGSMEGI